MTRQYASSPPMPVLEACVLIAAAIFSGLLVTSAITGGEENTRYVRVQMLNALAQTLGVGGSIAVAAVLLVGTGVWLAVSIRRYRRMQR